ncbi:MAG: protein BatD [Desulfobacterales bacterium]|nr:protein BatD [Desulfobacterales bacterium]
MKQLPACILFIFLFPVISEAAEIKAFVDRTRAALGESIRLTVSVSNGQGTVDTSPIRDFKVLSGGTSTSIQITNGRTSRETSYTYTLIPLKQGRLKVPALTVIVDGRRYNTREITVQVSKSPQTNANNRDVFAEARISKPNPFEGEQITYTLKFCNAVKITNPKFRKSPEFPGFTAKKIEPDKSYTSVISGREYNITELTYVLVPLNPGEKTIDSAIIKCDIVERRKRQKSSPFDSFFNDSFLNRSNLKPTTVMTDPLIIKVRPLPDYTGDVKFSGLVGKFGMRADLENNKLKVGDSTTLSVIISGVGNIMDVGKPELIVPKEFKVYEDNPEENINLNMSGYSGQKIFRTAIVPMKEGNYSLAPVKLSYFNIDKGQYQTLSTSSFSFFVKPSEEKDKLEVFSAPSSIGKSLKKKVEFTGRDILSLKEGLDALESHKSFSGIRFFIFLLVPAILYLLVKAALVFMQKADDPSVIMAERANKALKEAGITESSEEFLSCLYRALVSAILSKSGVKGESLTYAEAEEILRSKGYSDETAGRAAKLLEKIESAKFSGLAMEKELKKELLSETKQIITETRKN